MLSAVNQAVLEQLDQQQVKVDVVPVKLIADSSPLEGELDALVEFCTEEGEPTMVMARHRPYNRKSASVCFRRTHRQRVSQAQRFVRTVWDY